MFVVIGKVASDGGTHTAPNAFSVILAMMHVTRLSQVLTVGASAGDGGGSFSRSATPAALRDVVVDDQVLAEGRLGLHAGHTLPRTPRDGAAACSARFSCDQHVQSRKDKVVVQCRMVLLDFCRGAPFWTERQDACDRAWDLGPSINRDRVRSARSLPILSMSFSPNSRSVDSFTAAQLRLGAVVAPDFLDRTLGDADCRGHGPAVRQRRPVRSGAPAANGATQGCQRGRLGDCAAPIATAASSLISNGGGSWRFCPTARSRPCRLTSQRIPASKSCNVIAVA